MSNTERILIDFHRSKGDGKVKLHDTVDTSDGVLYLMHFYNSLGACYSSLDKIDENGIVREVARCHQLDERKMLDSVR